ncbi:phage portal protein [Caulobacter zeae]|uniref:Phage portal protein n=1 Tax=Caulobacter zeae TaxID=2055137 RepID=A0A2N5DGI0_9CAUL|nr:phage portal protein [Caulobacter zeae]PLR25165.1 phage portal protein [Caulobacter zeae]
MALFARRRVPEIKDSRAARLVALTSGGRPQWTPRDYGALASEGFAKNPVAYRCVRMIAEAAAAVPLAVFHGGRRADDHPLAGLLAAPNPEQGGPDLMEAFFGHLQVAGNGYLEASGEAAGEGPSELYALRPDRMAVVPGPRGWPAAYDYQAGGRTARIGRDGDGWLPVLHLKLFNPTSDHYGASPLEAAAFAIDVHNASGAWNKGLLDNAARPSGALVYGGRDGDRLSEEQFERLKAELAGAHAGADNAGRPLLLEGGLEWKPMSLTPADLDFVEGKHAAAREIALAFGVPPQLLGIPGDNTYANYREANGAFWRHTVVPLAERAARAITAWLAPKFPGARVGCDLDAVPALSAERDALWARLEAASFLTDEERRRLAGLEG